MKTTQCPRTESAATTPDSRSRLRDRQDDMPDPNDMNGPEDGGSPDDAARYIASLADELAQLARRNGFDALSYILEMARLEAEQAGKH